MQIKISTVKGLEKYQIRQDPRDSSAETRPETF